MTADDYLHHVVKELHDLLDSGVVEAFAQVFE